MLGANFGTDFSPPADALRVYTDAEQNVAVLADSGGAIQATSLTRAAGDINAGTAPDIFAIAYTNNYANAPSTVLYSLDAPTNSLMSTNPANGGVLNTVGRLTTTSTAASFTLTGGLDIVGGDNGLAVAALQPTQCHAVHAVPGKPADRLAHADRSDRTGRHATAGWLHDPLPITR